MSMNTVVANKCTPWLISTSYLQGLKLALRAFVIRLWIHSRPPLEGIRKESLISVT